MQRPGAAATVRLGFSGGTLLLVFDLGDGVFDEAVRGCFVDGGLSCYTKGGSVSRLGLYEI